MALSITSSEDTTSRIRAVLELVDVQAEDDTAVLDLLLDGLAWRRWKTWRAEFAEFERVKLLKQSSLDISAANHWAGLGGRPSYVELRRLRAQLHCFDCGTNYDPGVPCPQCGRVVDNDIDQEALNRWVLTGRSDAHEEAA